MLGFSNFVLRLSLLIIYYPLSCSWFQYLVSFLTINIPDATTFTYCNKFETKRHTLILSDTESIMLDTSRRFWNAYLCKPWFGIIIFTSLHRIVKLDRSPIFGILNISIGFSSLHEKYNKIWHRQTSCERYQALHKMRTKFNNFHLSFHEVVMIVFPEQRLVIAPIKFKVKSFRYEIKLEPYPDWSLLCWFNSNTADEISDHFV